jgi:hypothetical protein
MKDHFKTCNKSETETPPAQTPNSDSEAAQPQPSEHNQSSTNTSSGSIKSEGRSAAAGSWTRVTDMDAASEAAGAIVSVDSGTTNGGKA